MCNRRNKNKKNESVLGNSTDLCFIYESLSIQKVATQKTLPYRSL